MAYNTDSLHDSRARFADSTATRCVDSLPISDRTAESPEKPQGASERPAARRRKAGVLMPVFSLPSRFGIGDIGVGAFHFAEFLHAAGQSLWQVLPLNATDAGCCHSPYSPMSAFAGNSLLTDPDELVSLGLIDGALLDSAIQQLGNGPAQSENKVDYVFAADLKERLLREAWGNFGSRRGGLRAEFESFCDDEASWLDDWSMFISIKNSMLGKPWFEWPDGLKFRERRSLDSFKRSDMEETEYHKFKQFIFSRQMNSLRERLSELGVELIGDMPLYVTMDCADVWAHPDMFDLDDSMRPVSVAGVPPDYFSADGQLWGNPLYNWRTMKRDGFAWWTARLRRMLSMFDKVRIDHFRGLINYWAVPADAETAKDGEWIDVPYLDFFAAVRDAFPSMPFWAENLGILTDEVEDTRLSLGMPGMMILQFAFGSPAGNPYAPHNHTANNIVYTGTHDNNTVRGWFSENASDEERANLSEYAGRGVDIHSAATVMLRMALASVADTAVIPMQDWLGIGSEARMNTPSTTSGNWEWMMSGGADCPELAEYMLRLCSFYGR